MAIERAAEGEILAINCDGCLKDTFIPELDVGEENDEEFAWEQAEEIGWEKFKEENGTVLHLCPKCVEEENEN
jgi:hypothetical protein